MKTNFLPHVAGPIDTRFQLILLQLLFLIITWCWVCEIVSAWYINIHYWLYKYIVYKESRIVLYDLGLHVITLLITADTASVMVRYSRLIALSIK